MYYLWLHIEVILDLQSATVLVFNRERPKCGSLFALHLVCDSSLRGIGPSAQTK